MVGAEVPGEHLRTGREVMAALCMGQQTDLRRRLPVFVQTPEPAAVAVEAGNGVLAHPRHGRHVEEHPELGMKVRVVVGQRREVIAPTRSEEHTSELQSRQYLVCRLLLEK